MKKIFILLFIIGFITVNAQNYNKNRITNTSTVVAFACNFFTSDASYKPVAAATISDANATQWMESMINRITGICGLQNRFQLRARKNYNNCSAVCFSNNIGQDRFIEFDRDFLETYEKDTHNKWFVTGVVAHELGHHLNGHTLNGIDSRPNIELEADEFAGFILQKLGAPLAEAQAVFSFLNDTEGPPTHPVKKDRYDAIKRGWDKATGKQTYQTLLLNAADIRNMALQNLRKARKETNASARMEYIDRSLKLEPFYAEAWSEKGLAWLQKGNKDSAIHYCDEAVGLEPGIGLLWLNLASVMQTGPDKDLTKTLVDQALLRKPVFPAAYQFLADMALNEKNYEEALLNAEMTLKMRPDQQNELAEALATIATAQYYLGRYRESFDNFDQVKKIDPLNIKTILLWENAKNKAGDN